MSRFLVRSTIFTAGVVAACWVFAGPALAQDAAIAKARQLRLDGKPKESIAALTSIVTERPSSFLAHYNLGLAYANVGNTAATIRELQIAKEIKSKDKSISDGTIYNSLGWAYLQSGDYEHAVQEFRLAKDPAVYSTLSPASRQKVDNNLSLAESYLKAKAPAKP